MEPTDPVFDAVEAYKNLRDKLGHPPASREFYDVFPRRKLIRAMEGGNAYSRLQELAGDSPNRFSSPKSLLDDILLDWGKLARFTIEQHGRLPIQDDWICRDLKPTISGIEKSHSVKWSQLPHLFRDQFSDLAEWKDVVSAIPMPMPSVTPKDVEQESCFVYLMKDLRNGSHKIGISVDPLKRESTLQSEQPKTELVAAKQYINRKMALAMEKALHNLYAHKRKRGEWFDLADEDTDEIQATLDDSIV